LTTACEPEILGAIVPPTERKGIMVFATTKDGGVELEHMVPGERIALHCRDNTYVLEMNDTGNLVLDTKISAPLPEKLLELIRHNRNVQEVMYDRDIDMSDMKVYLRPSAIWRNIISLNSAYVLYAKAPFASMVLTEGQVYTTEGIAWIEPLDGNGPAIAFDTEKESA
jgi:hypothetical protein